MENNKPHTLHNIETKKRKKRELFTLVFMLNYRQPRNKV